jgi:hypothetical protein
MGMGIGSKFLFGEIRMGSHVTNNGNFGGYVDPDVARPFNSVSAYATLILTMLLPVGLWFSQSWFREVLQDFELQISQFTRLFLDPAMPYAALLLPCAVIIKEFVIGDQSIRRRCDAVFATLAIISLVFVGMGLGVPMWHLLRGLSG